MMVHIFFFQMGCQLYKHNLLKQSSSQFRVKQLWHLHVHQKQSQIWTGNQKEEER